MDRSRSPQHAVHGEAAASAAAGSGAPYLRDNRVKTPRNFPFLSRWTGPMKCAVQVRNNFATPVSTIYMPQGIVLHPTFFPSRPPPQPTSHPPTIPPHLTHQLPGLNLLIDLSLHDLLLFTPHLIRSPKPRVSTIWRERPMRCSSMNTR